MILNRLKKGIRGKLFRLVEEALEKKQTENASQLAQLVAFHSSPVSDRQSFHDHTKNPVENHDYYLDLAERMKKAGIRVEEQRISIERFEQWRIQFPRISKFYSDNNDVSIEKCLEHFLSYTYLQPKAGDIYLDVAAYGSPWAQDLREEQKTEAYRLDLCYPKGKHGIDIGADAADTSLEDNTCDQISLQCAFECFMGDVDLRFLREASRILKKGGRLAITPLYIEDTYFVATSPYCDQRHIQIEKEAKRVWQDDEYINPFARHYSPESLYTRIIRTLPTNLTARVLYFTNLVELSQHYRGQRIYCHFLLLIEKS